MPKTVIISSIGHANPSVANVLSDVLGISKEITVKMLYTAPTVLLHQIDDDLANKTTELLTALGLEIKVQDSTEPLPTSSESYDLAVYIDNPLLLPQTSKQLSEFLGCKETDAFNLLLNEPSVVLGGVSMASAEALSKRLNAEVIATNPKTDLYSLKVKSNDPSFLFQLQTTLKSLGINISLKDNKTVENLEYKTSQEIWRRYQSTNQIQIINQSYQRYEIVLNDVDKSNPNYRIILMETIGMPDDIIDDVLNNLPVQLEESVNRKVLQEKLAIYRDAGLKCIFKVIPFGSSQLIIENISNPEKAQEIIKQFYSEVELSDSTKKWMAPKPINHILNRYLAYQLESVGCVVETKIVEYEHN